jgi:hypothetical protein
MVMAMAPNMGVGLLESNGSVRTKRGQLSSWIFLAPGQDGMRRAVLAFGARAAIFRPAENTNP